MQHSKSCVHCGEKVIGRADKKFCDMDCRSNHNNQMNRNKNNLMRNVNRMLRINRNILMELSASGERSFSMDQLRSIGYNFSYCTKVVHTADGMIPFCYEFGLQAQSDNCYAIVGEEIEMIVSRVVQKNLTKVVKMRSNFAVAAD